MSKQKFDAILEEGIRGGVWVFIPFNVQETYGTRGQVKVKATIDGVPYRGSIAPMGGGKHILGVKKEIREAIGKTIGDTVHIVMEQDTKPRIVAIPEDFQQALENNPSAKKTFEKFAYTHRKEYVQWIESAKKPETRQRRIEKAVGMISARKKYS